ncbi:hypothetical protein [Fodinibius sp.]|uniref:hypothetical protein n=1 Tax=Fodinibius sp. TaxID=1872440 RepID=UPI002ACE15FF|nr:hypothetical protein [Fodinibius sp.]MDZ7658622.1 hypothetical protein [Fodinibius sp.]
MKTLAIIKKLVLFVAVGLLLMSCLKEDNWLKDNIEETGRHYPNISDFEIENLKDEYNEGEVVQLDLLFWSEDPIEEIVLRDSVVNESAQQVYSRFSPDEATFSEASQTDSLRIEYQIPTVPNDPSQINLEVEIVNQNGLSMTNVEADNFAAGPINITVIK